MPVGLFEHNIFDVGAVDHHPIDKAHRLTVNFANQEVVGKRLQPRIEAIAGSRLGRRKTRRFNLRKQRRIL